ncbi:MAG: hypothetical protein B7Y25_03130 [Alphaproteobacteria bacterium 16-39-46]|nr:MAG: hypothetical protein B7Y25_03130 [Alphaproteobacteria bacterium 16-39-46]OZA43406.1 MAG: hypothetical protein B7X84_03330 [Alphaproteobacteria bacterium 17-39-52]HQS83896.1 patatin-like phospholipase family protein [Alphaproteobacteria bacterium]HQS93715.1 patatin-like phospholipase family protein [Alphaproteobacteria bacterium]
MLVQKGKSFKSIIVTLLWIVCLTPRFSYSFEELLIKEAFPVLRAAQAKLKAGPASFASMGKRGIFTQKTTTSSIADASPNHAQHNKASGKNAVVRVLSIDGGGMRVLAPLKILQKIETDVNIGRPRTEHKEICDLFDVIVGTSSGGVCALALSVPSQVHKLRKNDTESTINRLIDVYHHRAGEFFSKSFGNITGVEQLRKMRQVVVSKYTSDGMMNIFQELFGEFKLSDARTNVLVPSYQLDGLRTFVFHNFPKILQSGNHGQPEELDFTTGDDLWMGRSPDADFIPDFLMKDVAVAACAAPSYFDPYKMSLGRSRDSTENPRLVDAGIFLNNPALLGYIHARRIFPTAKHFHIVSLGTGENPSKKFNLLGGGGLMWSNHFSEILNGGTTKITDIMLENLIAIENAVCNGGISKYIRLNPAIDRVLLDDTDEDSKRVLLAQTTAYLGDSDKVKTINEIVRILRIDDRYSKLSPYLPPYDPSFEVQMQKVRTQRDELQERADKEKIKVAKKDNT